MRTNPIVLKAGMTIGASAAEMDEEFLLPCFVTYPAVDQCLSVTSRGAVVHGRTGSGKTAILRYVAANAEHVAEIDPFEMSMSYVANSDVLQFLYAIGADLDLLFQVLWKHVLCIEYIRLRFAVADETTSRNTFQWITDRFKRDERKQKAVAYLRAWENKFWITMDQNIKELTEKVEDAVKVELGVEIDKFKAGGQYDKRLSVDKKSEMVHRVRKIISAEQLNELGQVIDLLSQVEKNEHHLGSYFILIDRLDEAWVDTALRFKMIRGLVESLKSFRRIPHLKILIALRSDVLERVVQETKDISFQREKLDDYFVHINWTKALLRNMVEKRIQSLFKKQYTGGLIGFDDLFPNRVGGSLPFDYMIERTLMRPRDVIMFVNECLIGAQGRYDVTATVIKQAEMEYSTKRRHSIEQEWQSAYPQIKRLLDFLASKRKALLTCTELFSASELGEFALSIYTSNKIAYDPLYETAEEYYSDNTSQTFIKTIVSILYRVGAIGVKLDASSRYQWAHMDRPLLPGSEIPDGDLPLRVHPMLHATFRIASSSERS